MTNQKLGQSGFVDCVLPAEHQWSWAWLVNYITQLHTFTVTTLYYSTPHPCTLLIPTQHEGYIRLRAEDVKSGNSCVQHWQRSTDDRIHRLSWCRTHAAPVTCRNSCSRVTLLSAAIHSTSDTSVINQATGRSQLLTQSTDWPGPR